MKSGRLKLRPLIPEDEIQFKKAVAEFRNELPPFEFAFGFNEAIPFIEYIKKLECWSRGKEVPETFVPSTFLVGVLNGQIVGRLSLRHRLNDFLERLGGHIGYGVLPNCRRRGYATEMLEQSFPLCLKLGIRKVLITCDVDNLASQRVIEKCGGVLENVTNDLQLKVQKCRYWIDVSGRNINKPT